MNVATASHCPAWPAQACCFGHSHMKQIQKTLSVADFLHLNCTVLRLVQSTNFSVNTSDAKSNADKRSHLQMNVATAAALLASLHATLATCDRVTDTLSVTDFC